MKKTCPSDFYLIGFPFFKNDCIFTHLFDFVCHVDVHEPIKAQQATAMVTPLEVSAVARFIRFGVARCATFRPNWAIFEVLWRVKTCLVRVCGLLSGFETTVTRIF